MEREGGLVAAAAAALPAASCNCSPRCCGEGDGELLACVAAWSAANCEEPME
jgi:hypothetical protein